MKRSILLSAALMLPLVGASVALAQTASPASPAQGTSSAMAPAEPGKSAAPSMAPANPTAAPVTAGTANLSKLDQMFVTKAAEGGLAEVQAAQVAQQKGQSDAVKSFAKEMVDDHTPANDKLTSLATAKGITAPTEPNAGQQKMLSRLQGLDGAKFDRAYIAGQLKAHQTMLKLFQREAANGQDADLKAFAEATVPTIQKHITMAQNTK